MKSKTTLNQKKLTQRKTLSMSVNRRGTATIEAALLTPLMLIITMGVLEVGQFMFLSQMISNASRVGGRLVCRDTTENVIDVENAVFAYFSHAYPGMDSSEIENGLDVVVNRANGTRLYGTDLENISTGERLEVIVSAEFSAFKWAGTIEYWQLEFSPVACYSRRE